MAGVRIRNLTHEFDDREVFASLEFESDASCLAITGRNGSGKSTLLRILAGLLTPSSGRAALLIDGSEVRREDLRAVVGLAAPEIRLYSELSARENIRFLLRARGVEPADKHIGCALDALGLADRADDPVQELSSGLRQRASLAAAIAHEPKALLLDEPSSNLDEAGIAALRNVIERQSKRGLVIIATNDAAEAELASGRLVLGNADEH